VERLGRLSLFGRSPVLHHYIRGLILAQEGRHAEAVQAFRRAVISWSDGYTRINFEMARSLMALGKPEEAIAVLRPALRGAVDASNLYLTRTEIHELLAQAFVRTNQRDSAAAHYQRVIHAWEHADPQFQPRLSAARAWLAAH
jgi:tetratricopeptide (TPR) repeat protein